MANARSDVSENCKKWESNERDAIVCSDGQAWYIHDWMSV